jgi:RNA polymerase sigma factor (sigma-70 family)
MISPYMYNFPRIVFASDPDCCGEFYEYMFVRLEKILKSYRDTGAKFVTWFTVVLRNRYVNFMREKPRGFSGTYNCSVISLDFSEGNRQSLYTVIAERRDFIRSDYAWYDELVERIVTRLNPRQRVFFHLYFVDSLRPEDVVFLSLTLDRSMREVMKGIDSLKEAVVHRYARKSRSLGKLHIYYMDLMRAQQEGDRHAAALIRNKRKSALDEYRRIKIHPSYEGLAGFLEIPLGTVSTGISRMKSAVRSILEELYHEKLPF